MDTGKSDIDDIQDLNDFHGRSASELEDELLTQNPFMASIQLMEPPRWIAHPESLRQKAHSSIVLTVSSQEEVDFLLGVGGAFMFGRYTTIKRYQDTKPVKQCTTCWSFDHFSARCNSLPKCRSCAGPHREESHVCNECPNTAKAQKGCTHMPIRCANCDGDHPADNVNCPTRQIAVGTTRSAPGGGRATRALARRNTQA